MILLPALDAWSYDGQASEWCKSGCGKLEPPVCYRREESLRRSAPLTACEHSLVRPGIERRLGVRDLSVRKLVPFRDQNRGFGRGSRLKLEEHGGIIAFGDDPFHIQPHRDLQEPCESRDIFVAASICLKKAYEYEVVGQIRACGSKISFHDSGIELLENLSYMRQLGCKCTKPLASPFADS